MGADAAHAAAIIQLRLSYFDNIGRAWYDIVAGSRWYVALFEKVVVGAYSIIDMPDYSQRWVMDLFRDPGHIGDLALIQMARNIETSARHDGFEMVCGSVDPKNHRQVRALLHRGYECTSLNWVKKINEGKETFPNIR